MMPLIVCLALCIPLIGFLVQLCASSFLTRKQSGIIASGAVLISFALFIGILSAYLQGQMQPLSFPYFEWIPVQGLQTNFSLHIDSLSLLMCLIITGVGFLIHVYSMGYMEYESDYVRYFAFLNFFIFSMLLLVLADNLLLLFVGWEGVGLASYLLIGYDYYRKSAADAATKAFVVNRIGDFGLLLGLLLTFQLFGTTNMAAVSEGAASYPVGSPMLTIIALLYFVGACGKSAQLPLHVWLADAMEGPTPVSALIHAATMVTAGVYLIVRMDALYIQTPLALLIIGSVGAATAIFAALAAVGQTELKRVLAYSTVSQLGFMFIACGAGAFYAAMFHLTMHAFVKALLFLSAGNVLHMLHGENDMRKMGGLRHFLPQTNVLFFIGALALAGMPPFAAFFSKDLILEQEHHAGLDFLFYVALTASTLTAFYMMRAYCLTFTGASRGGADKEAENPKEAPKIMLTPVWILAILSIVGGFLGFAFTKKPVLVEFLNQIGISPSEIEMSSHFRFSEVMALALAGGLLGITIAALLYTKFYDKLGHTVKLFKKAFYFDALYDFLFVRPLRALSKAISGFFEPKIFGESIQQVSQATQSTASLLQLAQSGQIRSYVAWMAIGAAFLLAYILSLVGTGVF